MKRFLRTLLFLIILAVAAVAGYLFIENDRESKALLEFVPHDFVYLVESDEPVKDWQDLSSTEVWQYIKGNEFFADITESADYLDSLLQENQTLVDFVELGNMVISAHMISREDYEFIVLVDLKGKGRTLAKVDPLFTKLLESLEYQVTKDDYFAFKIYDLYDPVAKEHMYLSFVKNVLVFSYDKKLLQEAITQSEQPSIMEQPDFATIRSQTNHSKLYNLYLNFATFEDLVGAYTSETPESLQGLDSILTYAGFDFGMRDDELTLDGYLLPMDSMPSYFSVFNDVGQGSMGMKEVLPISTASYQSIGFDDFADFWDRFMGHMAASDPEGHKDMDKSVKRVEKLLKIDFKRDFFAWMTEEVGSAIVPLDESGKEYAYYAFLHFDDQADAKERLDYVMERVKKRTPAKFKTVNYRGFEINYLALKGFFKLFFKKLFNKIETPHFTYIDDYVVFSNDTTSLQFLIESYLSGQTLNQDVPYDRYMDHFQRKSNIFTYTRNQYFYPYLGNTLDAAARRDLRANKNYLLSFPFFGMQIYPGGGMYEVNINADFEKYEPTAVLP